MVCFWKAHRIALRIAEKRPHRIKPRKLSLEERVRRTETLAYLQLMHRGAQAYLDGQRDLEKLRAAEQNASRH